MTEFDRRVALWGLRYNTAMVDHPDLIQLTGDSEACRMFVYHCTLTRRGFWGSGTESTDRLVDRQGRHQGWVHFFGSGNQVVLYRHWVDREFGSD